MDEYYIYVHWPHVVAMWLEFDFERSSQDIHGTGWGILSFTKIIYTIFRQNCAPPPNKRNKTVVFLSIIGSFLSILGRTNCHHICFFKWSTVMASAKTDSFLVCLPFWWKRGFFKEVRYDKLQFFPKPSCLSHVKSSYVAHNETFLKNFLF